MNNILIWSKEHDAFWRPNSCGYTDNPAKAGRYSNKEALEIVAGSHK